MVRRVEAAQATVDRFRDARWRWSSNDCARMAAFTLRKLGYRPPMPKAGSYRSALGAVRALRAAGFESLAAALDGMGLPRIAPAAALPGDILLLPSPDAVGALAVALGNGRVLCWHEDMEGAVVCELVHADAAWRADPVV